MRAALVPDLLIEARRIVTTVMAGWHGRRKKQQAFIDAEAALDKAVEAAVVAKEATGDVGGKLGTRQAGEALAARLAR